ncbi:Thioesterase superfamily protein [Nocardioides dokdonensis FR1436]|uniref:Acyl-coenzyme A thioesterase THEM4 n=1 Tax=Nocardioides dokdonensis FR1436 TaxID=1300347 RepID=A0A1A9GFM3_9ACTN|nr:PaaI family thioesterase [Nocardioides dokdonensis]ANH37044.1 Thioesterase superfamily protein [Nocardioides dokdonensis FR1436]
MSAVTTSEVGHDQVAAAAELTEATRRLMLAAATTDLDPDEVRAAGRAMDALTRTLSARSRPRALRAPFDGPADARAGGPDSPWRSFAYNPQAFPLEMHFDGRSARARTTANSLYEGPPGLVHGGFTAHLLDSLLGTLTQSLGLRAVTATLDLRYLAPTPLDVPLDLHARVVDTTGRRTRAEGWIEHDGVRTVEAHGLFIDITGRTR